MREERTAKIVLRGVSIDVTEQKRAEEKFRLAVEASPSGILLVNQTGQIVLVSSHIEELFGYRREELLGLCGDFGARRLRSPSGTSVEFLAATARAMGVGRKYSGRKDDVISSRDRTKSHSNAGRDACSGRGRGHFCAQARWKQAIQRREEVGHLSRVAVMGELTASMAHELIQPSQVIITPVRDSVW